MEGDLAFSRQRPVALCVVTPFGTRLGGSDNILWSYLRNLDRHKIQPTVVFLEDGVFVREVAGLGIDTFVLPSGRLRNPVHLFATSVRIGRVLRRLDPDVVLNWLSTAHLYAGAAAAWAGLGPHTVWWQLDLHTGGSFSRGRLMDRLAAMIPSAAIGACSEAAAEHQRRVRPRRPTFAVLPGIPEPTRLADAERAALSDEIGLDSRRPVVGTIGRLFAWKGHHRLVEAVALLREDGVDCQVLVVGGGGHRADRRYEAELKELVSRVGLDSDVFFTGQVPDASRFLSLMDVFVNCSTPEPFGLVILEAMASMTPVVAVTGGGPSEIIEPGISGQLAQDGSPAQLARALKPLLRDDGLRQRLSRGGRERFESRFREEAMAAEMTERLLGLSR